MSLNLDKRQRAMLREMGVRVWQPLAAPATVLAAPESIAVSARVASTSGHFDTKNQPPGAVVTPTALPAPVAPAARRDAAPVRSAVPPAAATAPSAAADVSASPQAAWQLGDAQTLYAPAAQPGGLRWLVLAETPASSLQQPVFDGDAGRLLNNMLRAARLHQADAALFAPLVRQAGVPASPEFSAALAALVEHAQPDVVLVMGRLAALALLQSHEPFGRLRGRVHALHGVKTIVTYDAAYLLRTPADKAKAWDDLCLAMSLRAGL